MSFISFASLAAVFFCARQNTNGSMSSGFIVIVMWTWVGCERVKIHNSYCSLNEQELRNGKKREKDLYVQGQAIQ